MGQLHAIDSHLNARPRPAIPQVMEPAIKSRRRFDADHLEECIPYYTAVKPSGPVLRGTLRKHCECLRTLWARSRKGPVADETIADDVVIAL
jgi:hypothetical protein